MQGARPGRLPPLAGGARTPGAAAVSLRDRAEAEAYVKKHSISALMRELTESVILHRPEHPEQFLQEVLARQAQQQRDEAAGAAAQAGPAQPRPPATQPEAVQGSPRGLGPLAAGAAPVARACRLSLRVCRDGPEGMASRHLSGLVVQGDGRMLAALEDQAAAMVHDV